MIYARLLRQTYPYQFHPGSRLKSMTLYLVAGPMKPYTETEVLAIQSSPGDRFGVVHYDAFYNQKEDKMWTVHEAPNEESLQRHLASSGYQAEWFQEVRSARLEAKP